MTGTSPVIEMGRKDSLSLNVEFVKVNISRTRKGLIHSEASSGSMPRMTDGHKAANIIRFSGRILVFFDHNVSLITSLRLC